MALYSEKVMDHFRHPRNVGVIEDADGVGEVGNAVCGDIMKIYLKIDDGIVTDARFETFGCGSAIATSSMATELIKGKPLGEAAQLSNKAVTQALDGLPARRKPYRRRWRTTAGGRRWQQLKNHKKEGPSRGRLLWVGPSFAKSSTKGREFIGYR